MEDHKHPKQPYDHNLQKKCKLEGCENLGYLFTCDTCGKPKMKTLCEKHVLEHKEMNRLYRGKLSVGAPNLRMLGNFSKAKDQSQ